MKACLLFLAALLTFDVSAADSARTDPMGGVLRVDPTVPPKGMNIMQILIENQALPLKGTGCDSGIPGDTRTLQHHLALTLGDGIDNKRNVVVITADRCKTDKHELTPGVFIDTWQCGINVVEKTTRGKYIANTSLRFWVKKDDWTMLPEKLLCM